MADAAHPTPCTAQQLADDLLARHHATRTHLSAAARGLLHPSWTTNQLATAALADLDATHPRAMPAPLPPQPLADVLAERERQDLKWGEQNHPDGTRADYRPLALLADHLPIGVTLEDATALELAAAAKQATDHGARTGDLTWWDVLLEETLEASAESDPAALRTELVQAAAVAVQWAQAIDRREAPRG